MALVNDAKLAEVFKVSRQHVHVLVKAGMPKAGRGQYDAAKCAIWYIHYLQEALKKKTPQNESVEAQDLRKEKAGLVRTQKELAELDLAVKRRQLISVEDSARIWEDAVTRTRSRLLAAVNKHAGQVVGLKKPMQARAALELIVHEALQEMVALGDEQKSESEANIPYRKNR